jgi:tetratricopeptide (TPR) repeat protein
MFAKPTLFAIILCFAISCSASVADDNRLLTELNNEAVIAIKGKNWTEAIVKLERALQLDPSYAEAQSNLAIANLSIASQLDEDKQYSRALKHYHHAAYYTSEKVRANSLDSITVKADAVVEKLGKNPDVAKDRIALGDLALSQADFISAAVEYGAAQKLADNDAIKAKIKDIQILLKRNKLLLDKAVPQ